MNKGLVLGLGQPLFDRLVKVSNKDMNEMGFDEIGGSIVVPNEKDFNSLISTIEERCNVSNIITGGSCCNTIKGLTMLGMQTGMLGKLGNDSLGKLFKSSVKALGATPLFSYSKSKRTGECVCMVTPDGQRTMRAHLGASAQMECEDLDEKHFKRASLFHSDGYNIYNRNLIFKAFKMAKKHNCKVSYDLGSYQIVRSLKDTILELLQYVDIVFMNDLEAKELFGDDENIKKKLSKLVEVAVITLGKKGCIILAGGKSYKFQGTKVEYPVDTTGAGDLFGAGFLYGYLNNYTIEECAKMGMAAGAFCVKKWGAELPIEQWEKVKGDSEYSKTKGRGSTFLNTLEYPLMEQF